MKVLPRSARLHRGADIARVSSRGARAHADGISVSVTLGGSPPARATVVVGRRAGAAVVRNRQRRRLQHAVAPVLSGLPCGTDVVVRGGPAVALLSPPALQTALAGAVDRALRRARSA